MSEQLPAVLLDIHEWDQLSTYELCMEPGILHGGDGGETLCGGAGRFAHYLTLTSAYYCTYNPVREVSAYFRRAYSLQRV